MYLVFRSKNAAVSTAGVYGVEIVLSKPTYVTETSDLVYVDLTSETEAAANTFIWRIYNNIGNVTIKAKVDQVISVGKSAIGFPTPEAKSRKIESGWKSCAPMAWARLTGTVSMSNL